MGSLDCPAPNIINKTGRMSSNHTCSHAALGSAHTHTQPHVLLRSNAGVRASYSVRVCVYVSVKLTELKESEEGENVVAVVAVHSPACGLQRVCVCVRVYVCDLLKVHIPARANTHTIKRHKKEA